MIAAAVAAWATTDVTPGDDTIDWWELCQPEDLEFRDKQVNLLEYGTRPNGTAAPAAGMFNLLPAFLAQQVVSARMPLLERRRDWILGPPQSDGRRSAVLWPPEVLENPKHGDSLVTAKITFHVETVPGHPVPSIHATLASAGSRSGQSPTCRPAATGRPAPPSGSTPPKGSCAPPNRTRCWHPRSRRHTPGKHGKPQWQWSPGLARVLARLTHLPFPNPEKVFTSPATAADEGAIRAYILYSEGTKSLAGDIDDLDQILALDEPSDQARPAR